MNDQMSILLVDDEVEILRGFEALLATAGIEQVVCCQNPLEVPAILAKSRIGVLLLDLWMPGLSGEELLAKVAETHPEIPVIVVTGVNEVQTAVRCMRQGAFDYLVKPVDEMRLISSVQRALDLRQWRDDYARMRRSMLQRKLEHPDVFAEIVTRSPRMLAVFQYLESVAPSSQPVCITGETGTGKELVARALHALSAPRGPFIAVNVAGLDDMVFSDTLFGHVRGAFTGADTKRSGMIEQAVGGTLFLDEIGDLSAASQTKLLRVIQQREYFPLGSDVPRPVRARVVAATNRPLEHLRDAGTFRRDLYHRLTVHHVELPPLRERYEDLPLLIRHLHERLERETGKPQPKWGVDLIALCERHAFAGNVRELESIFRDVSAMASSESDLKEILARRLKITGEQPTTGREVEALLRFDEERFPTLEEVEEAMIREAMRRSEGNQSMAARLLGISRPTLCKRLKKT